MSVQAEKQRKKISRLICIVINLVNIIALLIQIVYYIFDPWRDDDCIAGLHNETKCHHIIDLSSLKM